MGLAYEGYYVGDSGFLTRFIEFPLRWIQLGGAVHSEGIPVFSLLSGHNDGGDRCHPNPKLLSHLNLTCLAIQRIEASLDDHEK